jgi:hypothetical protein
VPETDGVALAEDPGEREGVGVLEVEGGRLGDDERLSLGLGVCEGVCAAVPVPVLVPEALIEGVALTLVVVEAVPESEPVAEGLAPEVSVGVSERDRESEGVELGELVAVGDTGAVTLPVGDELEDAELVGLGVPELLGVLD